MDKNEIITTLVKKGRYFEIREAETAVSTKQLYLQSHWEVCKGF